MKKRQKKNAKQQLSAVPATPRRWRRAVPILLAGLILAGAGSWWFQPRHSEAQPPTPSAMDGNVTSKPDAATPASSEFQKLRGRWLRPDGGYVVDVRNVDDAGRMDASYFNPRSIHVARAEASQDGDATKVFVELQDVNYPGSTYTLTYDPQTDRLWGIYYQAALRQYFEVVFVRIN
jgi:hypothetical protein